MNHNKITINILLIIIAIASCLVLVWEYRFEPGLLVSRTRYYNMMRIGDGFIRFNGKYKRLPEDLEEVVKDGLLPEKAKIYYCPMKHNTLREKEISYLNCEYEFVFEPKQIKIIIPDEVANQKRFGRLPQLLREYIVPDSVEIME